MNLDIDKKKLFELDDELEKLYPLVEYLRNKPDQDEPIRWAMNKVYHYIYLLRSHLSDYLKKIEELEERLPDATGKEVL